MRDFVLTQAQNFVDESHISVTVKNRNSDKKVTFSEKEPSSSPFDTPGILEDEDELIFEAPSDDVVGENGSAAAPEGQTSPNKGGKEKTPFTRQP